MIAFFAFAVTASAVTATYANQPEAAGLPRIAVYVAGGRDAGVNRMLANRLQLAFVNSSRYAPIERSEHFLSELDRELIRQRSGAVDDEQIVRLGRQAGAQFVCVVDITQALGSNQVSARIIDAETAELIAMGLHSGQLQTMADLEHASNNLVASLLGSASSPAGASPAIPVATEPAQPIVPESEEARRQREIDFYNSRAQSLLRTDVSAAIAALSRVIELRPGVAECFVNRGRAYLTMDGGEESAIRDFETALRIEPNNREIIELLERAQRQMQRNQRRELANRAFDKCPKNAVEWRFGIELPFGGDMSMAYQRAVLLNQRIEFGISSKLLVLDNGYTDTISADRFEAVLWNTEPGFTFGANLNYQYYRDISRRLGWYAGLGIEAGWMTFDGEKRRSEYSFQDPANWKSSDYGHNKGYIGIVPQFGLDITIFYDNDGIVVISLNARPAYYHLLDSYFRERVDTSYGTISLGIKYGW